MAEQTAKAAKKTAKKPGFLDKVKGGFAKLAKYFRDTKSELKKVVWPTREQSLRNTGMVIIVVVVAAIVMILLDTVFSGVVRLLIGV